MRELRHDFRAYYHCCYDEVEPDEAIDLIATLPPGSLWRAALDPHNALAEGTELSLQLVETVRAIASALMGGEELAKRADVFRYPRPWDRADQGAARAKAQAAAERLNNGKWRDVEHG